MTALGDMFAECREDPVMIIRKNRGAQDQELLLLRGFQKHGGEIRDVLEFSGSVKERKFCMDHSLYAAERVKRRRSFCLVEFQKLRDGRGAVLGAIFFFFVLRHAPFFQTGNGKEYVALTFAVIPIAFLISGSRRKKADLIIVEKSSFICSA